MATEEHRSPVSNEDHLNGQTPAEVEHLGKVDTVDRSSSVTNQLCGCQREPKERSRGIPACVIFIIAMATLVQGFGFLLASMFADKIPVLPTDPLKLIGTMYAVMGISFFIIFQGILVFTHRKSAERDDSVSNVDEADIDAEGNDLKSAKESIIGNFTEKQPTKNARDSLQPQSSHENETTAVSNDTRRENDWEILHQNTGVKNRAKGVESGKDSDTNRTDPGNRTKYY